LTNGTRARSKGRRQGTKRSLIVAGGGVRSGGSGTPGVGSSGVSGVGGTGGTSGEGSSGGRGAGSGIGGSTGSGKPGFVVACSRTADIPRGGMAPPLGRAYREPAR